MVPSHLIAPGTAPAIPWPGSGEAAAEVPSIGLDLASASKSIVPVASLTKMMTAYVVLQDHPLSGSDPGPQLTFSALDQADSDADQSGGDTTIPLVAGQVVSEREAIEGMLVHSANDVAMALARWDAGAGGVQAFVTKMNAQAAALGMRSTHYVDPTGLDAGSVSTAADQLRLAAAAMAVPAFAAAVDEPFVNWPGVGPLQSYVPGIGTGGIVGVKTGFTDAALGCVVLASYAMVAGKPVLVLADALGQGGVDPLGSAAKMASAIMGEVARALEPLEVITAHEVVGRLDIPWARSGAAAVAQGSVTLVVWPGDAVSLRVLPVVTRVPEPVGSSVALVCVSDRVEAGLVSVRTTVAIRSPSITWKLL